MPEGKLVMPLLKFLESLEDCEDVRFGKFDIAKFEGVYEIYLRNQVLKYDLKDIEKLLTPEGILVDGIMALDLSTLSMETRQLLLKRERNLKNKLLKVITDNGMDFELVSKDNKLINDFGKGASGVWINSDGKRYLNIELKFVESDTLQVWGDDKLLFESHDCFVNVYNVAYEAH